MANQTAESSRININLGKSNKPKFNDVFFGWIITIGKLIIIITELIALSALGYRFVIDRQLSDIHDQISIKQAYVKVQEKKEADYRSLQTRLNNIGKLTKSSSNKLKNILDLNSMTKENSLVLTRFSSSLNNYYVEGNTAAIFNLNQFINSLKKSSSVSSVSLDSVGNKQTGIDFKLSIVMKE